MENPLKGKYDIGVIIGRFQVPGLSNGHRHLIDNVVDSHKQVIVVIGVSPTLGTKKNPLGYTSRMQMFKDAYPDAIVTHVLDVNCDKLWSKNLDTTIRAICPTGSICLYGGRDSFINSYKGIYPTFEIGTTDKKEGVKIREEIGKETIPSYDFRAGMIHQSQNQFPRVFPTVDIAVLRKENKHIEVLMGTRTPDSGFRFPGGFVDPTDENLEDAALREIHEEVDCEVDPDSLKYVGSRIVNDWRYNTPDEKIITSLYTVDYSYGTGDNNDEEFEKMSWVKLNSMIEYNIEGNHRELFNMLKNHLKIKNKKG